MTASRPARLHTTIAHVDIPYQSQYLIHVCALRARLLWPSDIDGADSLLAVCPWIRWLVNSSVSSRQLMFFGLLVDFFHVCVVELYYSCPDTAWILYNAFCYLVVNIKTNWMGAYVGCLRQRAKLTSISNQEEEDFVTSIAWVLIDNVCLRMLCILSWYNKTNFKKYNDTVTEKLNLHHRGDANVRHP